MLQNINSIRYLPICAKIHKFFFFSYNFFLIIFFIFCFKFLNNYSPHACINIYKLHIYFFFLNDNIVHLNIIIICFFIYSIIMFNYSLEAFLCPILYTRDYVQNQQNFTGILFLFFSSLFTQFHIFFFLLLFKFMI